MKTKPSPLYWKFWRERVVSVDTGNLGEFELDSDFWGSNEHAERELIGDTSLTNRLYLRQLCGLYNKARYEAFRDLVDSTEDRLIVFYNFTAEYEAMKAIAERFERPVSVVRGGEDNRTAYERHDNSITFIQYQAGISKRRTRSFILHCHLGKGLVTFGNSQRSVFTASVRTTPVSIITYW